MLLSSSPTVSDAAARPDPSNGPAWDRLVAVLDEEAAAGRRVDLWWRDDDATAPSPALDRLLDLTADAAAPLALAVIPAHAGEALARQLDDRDHVSVLLHGWAHTDHAPEADKRTELGDHRPLDVVAAELRDGWQRLRVLFGERALPVVVPPWNRIGAGVRAALPGLGFSGLSAFGREDGEIPGLVEANVHLDPIVWAEDNRFAGPEAMIDTLIGEITAPDRAGRPIGLMTHHWAHGPELWDFLERLAALVGDHAGARWLAAPAVFAPAAPAVTAEAAG